MKKLFLQVCYLRAGDTGITQRKIVKNEKKEKKCRINKISFLNVADDKYCEDSMEGKEEMENEEVYTMQVEGCLLVRFSDDEDEEGDDSYGSYSLAGTVLAHHSCINSFHPQNKQHCFSHFSRPGNL